MPDQLPAVAAGLDPVTDPGNGALCREGDAVLVDPAQRDQLGPQRRAGSGGGLVGADEQQRLAAGEGVGQPGASGAGLGLLGGAGVDEPAVLGVLVEHGLVAVAQPQRCRSSHSAAKRRTSASS